MPTPTYTPLATVTLGSSASSVTFSSIPATYRDLVVAYNGQTTTGGNIELKVNGDSSNSSVVAAGVFDTTIFSFAANRTELLNFDVGRRQTILFNAMDYSATDKHKTILVRGGADNNTGMVAFRWASTSAVTSLFIACTNGTFNSGSTFSLYGIVA
jgi:hypothetical protein